MGENALIFELLFSSCFSTISRNTTDGNIIILCHFSVNFNFELCFMSHLLISGGAKQWTNLFPRFSKRYPTNISLSTSYRKKGVRVVASDTTGRNGGVLEISGGETAPRSYAWPDKKVALLSEFLFCKMFRHRFLSLVECILMKCKMYLLQHEMTPLYAINRIKLCLNIL